MRRVNGGAVMTGCALALGLVTARGGAAQQTALSLSEASGSAGSQVEIGLALSGASGPKDVVIYDAVVVYAPGKLTYLGCRAGDSANASPVVPESEDGATLVTGPSDYKPVNPKSVGNGTLAWLKFEIAAGAHLGDIPVRVVAQSDLIPVGATHVVFRDLTQEVPGTTDGVVHVVTDGPTPTPLPGDSTPTPTPSPDEEPLRPLSLTMIPDLPAEGGGEEYSYPSPGSVSSEYLLLPDGGDTGPSFAGVPMNYYLGVELPPGDGESVNLANTLAFTDPSLTRLVPASQAVPLYSNSVLPSGIYSGTLTAPIPAGVAPGTRFRFVAAGLRSDTGELVTGIVPADVPCRIR